METKLPELVDSVNAVISASLANQRGDWCPLSHQYILQLVNNAVQERLPALVNAAIAERLPEIVADNMRELRDGVEEDLVFFAKTYLGIPTTEE